MKYFILFTTCIFFFSNNNAQSLVVQPDSISKGTYNTIVFSGTAINFSTNPCIQIYLKQGSNIIYQASSNIYYSASNTLVTAFYVASNALIGNYDIIFIDTCTWSVLSTHAGKMKVKLASSIHNIIEKIKFILFPNPVKKGQDLEILSDDNFSIKNSLNIYSIEGKRMSSLQNIKNLDKINTSNLGSGIYYIEFIDNNGNKIAKKITVE